MNRTIPKWLPSGLLAAHLAALVFGLIGILVMLPNPDLWADDPNAVKVFDYSMRYAGAVHIILGALTMYVIGVLILGWKHTTIFAVVSMSLSLASELIGTGTGWPFGNYEYTSFLGYKVLDRVPYSIPLSWFYMGLASYLLAVVLVRALGMQRATIWALALGTWFLTVWDLVLDPAMAHESLSVRFWVWDERGPYFGMPVKNFIGWALTGLLFMALSRGIWRRDAVPDQRATYFSLIVYLANMAFAMILSLSVDLWIPVLLAIVLGVIPAIVTVWPKAMPRRYALRWAEDV